MPENSRQQSATIYQFPAGGRTGLIAAQSGREHADKNTLPNRSDIALTDAWYHQEAIRDARLAGQP